MAFGFGFNKQKVLSAAEKYVQQGKLQNAIAEYEKVLKADAKDLTVTNTVGDLYSRLGEVDKATEAFKIVGDAYASQGFTVKAIAMYKKISKLKPSLESVLKLAELYTQQGLFNDARAQYLQVAEEFLKSGELENAVRIFQKILEMDPDNVNMRVRLAEVYIRLGKKNEAWQIFSAAAETMRAKGSLNGAEEVLQRMLKLDPGNSYALLMQGKNLIESGDAEAGIASLHKIGDLDSNPEGLRDLLKAYLQVGRLSDAGTVATKLLTIHNDHVAIATFADALMQAGQYESALQVYDQHADRLLSENSSKVLENLHVVIGHVRDNPASLEKLLDLFHKAGENTHISEVTELLAHASVQSGDLMRARDLYQKLATVEPQNQLHMQNYQQVVNQLSGSSGTKLISSEEASVIVDELEATAPSIHQHYSDEVALAVRSALTDAELFISYNMPAKALGPLVAALPQAPGDLRLNQRLAALHTRAGRFSEAAVCCRTLQSIYSEAEYPEEATRYGELADRYEERSSSPAAAAMGEEAPMTLEMPSLSDAVEEIPTQEAVAEADAASPWPSATPAAGDEFEITAAEPTEFAVVDQTPEAPAEQAAAPAEIDLSEWEDTVTVEEDAPAAAIVEPEAAAETGAHDPAEHVAEEEAPETDKIAETIEEIRFYLANRMPEQAWAALAKLQTLTSNQDKLAEIRAEVEAATQEAADEEIAATAESEEIAVEDIPVAEPVAEDIPEQVEEEPVAEELAAHAPAPHLEAEVSSPEPEPEPAPTGALKEFVADLDASLGEGFLPGAVPATAQPKHIPERPVAAASSQAKGPVLGEFVADLESSLGDDFLKAAPVAQPQQPVAKAQPAPPAPVAAPKVSAPLAASAAAGATTSARPVPPAPPAAVTQPTAGPVKPKITPGPIAASGKASAFGEDAGVDLAEMFGELKQDLESGVASADEDPETHYNLGIAFREMGLLDEAIGELQKACQAVDHGHSFPQIMQTYTWLAQCFLDKQVPEAAVRWYEKALGVAGIDGETRVALNYELASAHEAAGNKPAALKHFMDVYGSNIDYRDIAERIKAVKS
jgi:tetratricopeptide (TPR) repeat protein